MLVGREIVVGKQQSRSPTKGVSLCCCIFLSVCNQSRFSLLAVHYPEATWSCEIRFSVSDMEKWSREMNKESPNENIRST